MKKHESRIRLFCLPNYSPELNPDDVLNQDEKKTPWDVSGSRGPQELISNLRSYLWSRQRRPYIVRNYYKGEHVRYAAM